MVDSGVRDTEQAHPQQLQLCHVGETVLVYRVVDRLVHLPLDAAAVLPKLSGRLAGRDREECVLGVARE